MLKEDFEINDEFNVNEQYIKSVLKYYVPNRWHDLNNWSKIMNRYEKIDDNLFLFRCSFLDLYFDKNMHILEYENIFFSNGKVYYEISNNSCFKNYFGELCLGVIK